jgi:putative spermidine/putrescine transport system substrate-binding protein
MRRKRALLSSIAGLALVVTACGAPSSSSNKTVNASDVPATPKHAVTLDILDIAGNLQLTKGMIENFVKANPNIVKGVNYSQSPAPDMAGKLKAQQNAGRVQTDLVLTGTDGLSAGIAQHLLTRITPEFNDRFPNLMGNYQKPAAAMQQLAQGFGVEVVYYPSGPLLEYNPAKVSDPPSTPAELLAWAKAHPGRFQYAMPENSGPGRTFLMGLPYLLGDKDPKDPVHGWAKTWSYLQQLGKYVQYYPSGTTDTMKNLASGSVDMIASTTGWDINPRVLGTVPNTEEVTPLQPMHWVTDAQYAVIPKGVSNDVLAADLALIKWMLKPDQQAIAFDDGYFYPGPAVKDVTVDMAPAKSRQVIAKFGRPQYSGWISKYPTETSLPATEQVTAFDRWDRTVGSGKKGG